MYDTVELLLSKEEAKNIDFLSEIPIKLNNCSFHRNGNTNFKYCTGYIGSLKVKVSENSVSIIKGSLCKWHFGNNFETLKPYSTKEAIENLSNALNLPMHKAEVKRFDIAVNIDLDYDIKCYLNRFGELPRFNRLEQQNGLYYNSSINKSGLLKQIIIYDKNSETKAHRDIIPSEYAGSNILRFEVRFLKKPYSLFNLNKITAEKLYDEKFYFKLVKYIHSDYSKIKKIRLNNRVKLADVKSLTQFNNISTQITLSYFGGLVEFQKALKEAQKNGLNKNVAFKIKQKVLDVSGKSEITRESDYIQELDDKFKQMVEFLNYSDMNELIDKIRSRNIMT